MVGAVLAGGSGSRLAGAKPTALLAGRPLIAFPLAALAELCDPVAVICKRGTELPELEAGVERWEEPDEPRHPITGIIHALERAEAPVVVLASDRLQDPSLAPKTAACLQSWSLAGQPTVAPPTSQHAP